MPRKPWRAFGRYFVSHIIVTDPSIIIKTYSDNSLKTFLNLQLTSCVLVGPPLCGLRAMIGKARYK